MFRRQHAVPAPAPRTNIGGSIETAGNAGRRLQTEAFPLVERREDLFSITTAAGN
jgi:hypothetical protein